MLKKWVPLWVIPTLILFATGTVWLRLYIVRTTYLIHLTDTQIGKAKQEGELLQVKVAALRTPRRLEVLARTRFGLGQPRVDQLVQLTDGALKTGQKQRARFDLRNGSKNDSKKD